MFTLSHGHWFPLSPAFLKSAALGWGKPHGRVKEEVSGPGPRHYSSGGMGEAAAGVLEVGDSGGTGLGRCRAERGGCRAGRGSSVIRAEIDGKGRHRRQRESIKREDHIRGDRESFKLQGLLPPRGGGRRQPWSQGRVQGSEGRRRPERWITSSKAGLPFPHPLSLMLQPPTRVRWRGGDERRMWGNRSPLPQELSPPLPPGFPVRLVFGKGSVEAMAVPQTRQS